jgi:hypothetical protein
MTEIDGVLLADNGYSVLLHRPVPYSDGHGYRHRIDLIAGPFQGTIDATTYVNVSALNRFREALVGLYQNLKGDVQLAGYENFTLSLKGDGLGHITVRVEAIAGPCMDTRLTYTFNIDQTQLPQAISSLERFTPK